MKKLIGKAVVAAGILGSFAFMSCGSKNEMQLGKTGKPKVTFMLIDYDGSPLTGEHAPEVVD